MLVHLGFILGHLSAMLKHFGAMLGLLEPMLGHFGAMLAHSKLSFAIFALCWSQVGAKKAQMAKTSKSHRFFRVFSVLKLRFPPKTIENSMVFFFNIFGFWGVCGSIEIL